MEEKIIDEFLDNIYFETNTLTANALKQINKEIILRWEKHKETL